MNTSLRIIYMGTPAFAVPPLKELLDSGYDIPAVITAPDKPAGRGKKLLSSDVKQFALAKELKVLQPENLKDPVFLSELKSLKADLQVVVAFRMLPEQVWSMPPKGTINLHASLLPQYRGAAPINHAIMNGEKITGVTTFFINHNIDTGKIILQEKVEIPETFSAGDLHDLLMTEGAKLVVKTIEVIETGTFKEIPQETLTGKNTPLLPAPKIYKEDCRIKWDDDPIKVYNFIRGLSPTPSAFSELSGEVENIIVKIFSSTYSIVPHKYKPGTLFIENRKRILVAVKNGFICPDSLQQAGKKRMDAASFINGFPQLENYSLV